MLINGTKSQTKGQAKKQLGFQPKRDRKALEIKRNGETLYCKVLIEKIVHHWKNSDGPLKGCAGAKVPDGEGSKGPVTT